MNVIVSNKQKNIIDNANIDAIKDLNGLFSVDDLINKFKNYFFSKMILDATSVIDFTSDSVLNKLARDIGSDRLIILLPASPEPPKEFTDKLINLKIYNFSNKIEDIVRFINYPNTQGGVSKENSLYVDNSINENELINNNFANNMINSNNSYSDMLSNFDINDNTDVNTNTISNENDIEQDTINNINESNDVNNTTLESTLSDMSLNDNISNNYNDIAINENSEVNNDVHNEIDNSNIDNIDNMNNINDNIFQTNDSNINSNESNVNDSITTSNNNDMNINSDNSIYENNIDNNSEDNNSNIGFYLNQTTNKKIIGIKNVTIHAGSTTLAYLLTKMLKDKYKKRVSAVEINKNDFKYYQDNTTISVSAGNVTSILNNNDEIIIVDLNDCHDTGFCSDIIYLVEPSIIKLNRLMMENRFIFRELHNKKIILNKSLLTPNDVKALSKEAGVEMFMNISPVNDRIDNQVIEDLIKKLGLN